MEFAARGSTQVRRVHGPTCPNATCFESTTIVAHQSAKFVDKTRDMCRFSFNKIDSQTDSCHSTLSYGRGKIIDFFYGHAIEDLASSRYAKVAQADFQSVDTFQSLAGSYSTFIFHSLPGVFKRTI